MMEMLMIATAGAAAVLSLVTLIVVLTRRSGHSDEALRRTKDDLMTATDRALAASSAEMLSLKESGAIRILRLFCIKMPPLECLIYLVYHNFD